MKNNSNKLIFWVFIFAITVIYIFNQGWINLNELSEQTFAINKVVLNPFNDGQLYYGCKSPISMVDCVYYGTEYYQKEYINIENIGCREKTWGVECTFNGDKIL